MYSCTPEIKLLNGNELYINDVFLTIAPLDVVSRLRAVGGIGPWFLCNLNGANSRVGDRIYFHWTCYYCDRNEFYFNNPGIDFGTVLPNSESIVHRNANFYDLDPEVDGVRILKETYPACNFPKTSTLLWSQGLDGLWYRYSPRMKILENTVENPSVSIKQYADPLWNTAAPKDYSNEFNCKPIQTPNGVNFQPASFQLNETVLRKFFELSNVYAYYITGLSPKLGPCQTQWARFMKTSGQCTSPLQGNSVAVGYLSNLISNADDGLRVTDIETGLSGSCVNIPAGSQIQIGNACWKHVHEDEFSVYDFSSWKKNHPGGPIPIAAPANQNSVQLVYPGNHPINRWEDHRSEFPFLGILGSKVDFLQLPSETQQLNIGYYIGAITSSSSEISYTEACGSPGEVKNNPTSANRYFMAYKQN